MTTCKIVKAPTDIPRIIDSPVFSVLARRQETLRL
jgi:hypothetical protein